MTENHPIALPDGFVLKNLNLSQLDEICNFLNHNWIENLECNLQTIFSRDYLYWYLKYVPPGFIIGLVHKRKLVGLVTAIFIDMIIYGTKLHVPHINYLCVHSKLRNLGLATSLITRIRQAIVRDGFKYALYVTNIYDDPSVSVSASGGDEADEADGSSSLDSLDTLDSLDLTNKSDDGIKSKPSNLLNLFCELKSYAVPINHKKLISVGFLPSNYTPEENLSGDEVNPLHLLKKSDLESVITKLNLYLDKFKIRTYFTLDMGRHMLIPKKNIVYSFVKKSADDVTDFISISKSCFYSSRCKKIIYTANITYYYYETMTLTEMVTFLIAKLPSYGIDQLNFNTMAHNENINVTKYLTNFQECFFYNLSTPKTISADMMFGQY